MSSPEGTASPRGGGRDEMRERWDAYCARPTSWSGLEFAQREADRAWNEALELVACRLQTALMGDLRCTPESFGRDAAKIARMLKRPSPPAQQDDKPEAVMAPRGETPARESSPSPAPFDLERRARELQPKNSDGSWMRMDATLALAREAHAAGRREAAEEIARKIETRHTVDTFNYLGGSHECLCCAEIARSHARPPQPAPETNEERVAMLERALRIVVDEYDANRCGTTSGWKREEPGARFVDAIDKARRALGGGA